MDFTQSPRSSAQNYIDEKLNPIIEPLVTATFKAMKSNPDLDVVSRDKFSLISNLIFLQN